MSASFCNSSSTAVGGALSRLKTVKAKPPTVSRLSAHAGDVHAMLAEHRAEEAHDAGTVRLFISSDVAADRDLHRLAVEPHDARVVGRTEEGAAGRDDLLRAVEGLRVQPFVEGDGFVGFLSSTIGRVLLPRCGR
jgi:hypothetical protein